MQKVYQKTCPACQKEFGHIDKRQKYCSMACRASAYNGEGNPHWKNGGVYNEYHHIQINKVRKSAHRRVVEAHIGRELHSWEQVHHKDGNKLNNVFSNLEVVTHKEHKERHRNPRTETHKRCAKCKKFYPFDMFQNRKQSYDGLNARCKNCTNIRVILYKDTEKKQCAQCFQILPRSDFYTDSKFKKGTKRDPHRALCRECTLERDRENRQKKFK